jgi:hypothetical protein
MSVRGARVCSYRLIACLPLAFTDAALNTSARHGRVLTRVRTIPRQERYAITFRTVKAIVRRDRAAGRRFNASAYAWGPSLRYH